MMYYCIDYLKPKSIPHNTIPTSIESQKNTLNIAYYDIEVAAHMDLIYSNHEIYQRMITNTNRKI